MSDEFWTFLVAQMVKNLLAKWETWVQSLGWADPLEKGILTPYSHQYEYRVSIGEEEKVLEMTGGNGCITI